MFPWYQPKNPAPTGSTNKITLTDLLGNSTINNRNSGSGSGKKTTTVNSVLKSGSGASKGSGLGGNTPLPQPTSAWGQAGTMKTADQRKNPYGTMVGSLLAMLLPTVMPREASNTLIESLVGLSNPGSQQNQVDRWRGNQGNPQEKGGTTDWSGLPVFLPGMGNEVKGMGMNLRKTYSENPSLMMGVPEPKPYLPEGGTPEDMIAAIQEDLGVYKDDQQFLADLNDWLLTQQPVIPEENPPTQTYFGGGGGWGGWGGGGWGGGGGSYTPAKKWIDWFKSMYWNV